MKTKSATPTGTNHCQRQAQRLSSKLVPRGLLAGLLAVLCLALPSRAFAGHDFAVGGPELAGPNGNFANGTAHLGETITARFSLTNADTFFDHITITNIHYTIHYASGDVVTPNILPGPGTFTLAGGQGFTSTHAFICAPGNPAALPTAGNAGLLSVDAVVLGVDERDAAGGPPTPFNAGEANYVSILIPGIECRNFCTNVGPTGTIGFSGYVTNTGNTLLGNAGITNSVNGVLTILASNLTLPVGGSVTFSNSYQGGCGPNTNTIFAGGVDALASNVTSQCTATCTNTCLFGLRADASKLFLSFATVTDRAYTVQFTVSLSPADWKTLTNLPGDGAVATVRDSLTNAQRFYRLLTQ